MENGYDVPKSSLANKSAGLSPSLHPLPTSHSGPSRSAESCLRMPNPSHKTQPPPVSPHPQIRHQSCPALNNAQGSHLSAPKSCPTSALASPNSSQPNTRHSLHPQSSGKETRTPSSSFSTRVIVGARKPTPTHVTATLLTPTLDPTQARVLTQINDPSIPVPVLLATGNPLGEIEEGHNYENTGMGRGKLDETTSYENINMDHIARLTGEGFSQDLVIRALGISRNDVEMARDILNEFGTRAS